MQNVKGLTEYAKKRYSQPVFISKNMLAKFSIFIELCGREKDILDLASGCGLLKHLAPKDNDIVELEVDTCDLQKDKLPFVDNSFDVVVASEIIEHIWDCDRLLAECKRVLRVGGKLIISTPNLASLGRRFLLLLGKNPYVENFLYPIEAGHVKHFVKADLEYLLKRNGYIPIKWLSDVVILTSNGQRFSTTLARLFPALGRSIIVECKC